MTPCSSCGYQFETDKLTQTGTGAFCKVCIAIGAHHLTANPNVFGDAKYLIPPLAWCTNHLLAAIATRAEGGEDTPKSSDRALYLIGTEPLEMQDAQGRPWPDNLEITKVEGTDFVKMGPFYLKV